MYPAHMQATAYAYLAEHAKAVAHTPHERRADYYYAFAGELMEGDGLRLLPLPGKGVPVALVCPLVVHAVERSGDTVRVTVYDRASMVSTCLLGEACPDATVATVVYDAAAPVLLRY